MSHSRFQEHLHAYISVREALGFQMRAERTLLQDFVRSTEPADVDADSLRARLV